MRQLLPLILLLGKGAVAQARYKILKSYNIEQEWILDAGCGSGQFSIPLSKKNLVVGLDIFANDIRKAKARVPLDYRLELVVADCRHLPFKEHVFTKIICFEVIEHMGVSDAVLMLREFKHVIKSYGSLLLSTPKKDRLLFSDYTEFGHVHEYTKTELYELLKSEFSDVKVKEYCGIVPTILDNFEVNLFSKLRKIGGYSNPIIIFLRVLALLLPKLDEIGEKSGFFVESSFFIPKFSKTLRLEDVECSQWAPITNGKKREFAWKSDDISTVGGVNALLSIKFITQ